MPTLQPASPRTVGSDHPAAAAGTLGGLPFALRPQVQMRLQQLPQQLPPLLGQHLLQPIVRQGRGLRVGELSDQPVEGVLRGHKAVNFCGIVIAFHRGSSSRRGFEHGWHPRT
ncbi:hypothetical protein ETD83_37070 [Actinomadura soli]|uniref:Uncharacterized protein n=1 Tax=Actinomadura soli TaxID=2508997 RepID=A0A5C4J0S6_9ACTN|nr:hypothetical protein [Actinomadura soli]TMQ90068.1 hypothetical protein ETD83_37070 [Actinomadura soli]